jgi:transcription elongation factor GreA
MQLHEPILLTREAMDELKAELDDLRLNRRRVVADMLRDSRENNFAYEGDASYDPARDEQAFVEGRIMELEQRLAHARLIDTDAGRRSGRVALGSTVVVEDAQGKSRTFQVVNPLETNPAQGKVSNASPVGKALLGAATGDTVSVQAPKGVQRFTVREIK